MTHYSVGLFFTADLKKVALIRKAKPQWQKGKLNGVGGKVEEGETFHQAMAREFHEETGIFTYESDWKVIVEQEGQDYALVVFAGCHTASPLPDLKSEPDEPVEWFDVATVCAREDIIPNVKWFIWLALDNSVTNPIKVKTL